ncbi:MAG TPA: hypothetical protein VIF62_39670, partial [Labilithrix sp.]
QSLVRGSFWQGAAFHALVLAFLGAVYAFQTRNDPRAARVHPLWFTAMTLVMPVTYLIATPLAMFTLHSSSWETRNHGAAKQAPEPAPVAAPEPALAQVIPIASLRPAASSAAVRKAA